MTAQTTVMEETYNPLFDKMKERFRVQGKYTLAEVMNKRAAHPSSVREKKVRHTDRATYLFRRAGVYLSVFVVAVSLVLVAVIGSANRPVGPVADVSVSTPDKAVLPSPTPQGNGDHSGQGAEEGGFYSFRSTLNGNLN